MPTSRSFTCSAPLGVFSSCSEQRAPAPIANTMPMKPSSGACRRAARGSHAKHSPRPTERHAERHAMIGPPTSLRARGERATASATPSAAILRERQVARDRHAAPDDVEPEVGVDAGEDESGDQRAYWKNGSLQARSSHQRPPASAASQLVDVAEVAVRGDVGARRGPAPTTRTPACRSRNFPPSFAIVRLLEEQLHLARLRLAHEVGEMARRRRDAGHGLHRVHDLDGPNASAK
jgi:hypothetical protein